MAPHTLEMVSCYNKILEHRGNYRDESVAYSPP